MFNKEEYMEEYNKNYYQNHKEYNSKYCKNYYREHREQKRERDEKYREENQEKILECNKEWTKTGKGRANSQRGKAKRRAREKNIINTLTSQEWLDILKEYDYRCAYCGCEFDENTLPTRDHIIPISRGGHNTRDNVVPACRSCNSKKNNKILAMSG